MTKKELIWLIIRLSGVYFGYLAVVSLFSVIFLLPGLIFAPPELKTTQKTETEIPVTGVQPTPFNLNESFPSENSQTKNSAANAGDKTDSEAVKKFLWYILLTAVYGAVSFYLLRDGRLFFWFLVREEVIKVKEPEPEVTTLNL